MGMEKMGTPSPEDQSKIQGERALSDLELVKGGAQFQEGGRLEATAEQVESAKKEMQTEKAAESPEIKSLEELKTRAQEAGASPEDIKVLENKLEQARDGGEAFIAKKEDEYNKTRSQESELAKSLEQGGKVYEKVESRKTRDMIIGGLFALGATAGYGLAVYSGVDIYHMSMASIGAKMIAGATGIGVGMMTSPIARIQNWFERRKVKKEISKAGEEKEKAYSEYKEAKFGK